MTKPDSQTTLAKGKAIHLKIVPETIVNGKWTNKTEEREVRVMAIAEGYAMVRRKGAMPYVCSISELRQ